MIWMILRVVVLWTIFTVLFEIEKVAAMELTLAAVCMMQFIMWANRRQQTPPPDVETEVLEMDMAITNAGKTIAAYLGKEYPLWLEVNGHDMYVFNGQSSTTTVQTLQVSANEFVIAPNISYKMLDVSNQDFLADRLGIPVKELTCFDYQPPKLVEA